MIRELAYSRSYTVQHPRPTLPAVPAKIAIYPWQPNVTPWLTALMLPHIHQQLACVVRRNTGMPRKPPGAVWKRSTSACRASARAILPSMRQKFQPRALTAACRARTQWGCCYRSIVTCCQAFWKRVQRLPWGLCMQLHAGGLQLHAHVLVTAGAKIEPRPDYTTPSCRACCCVLMWCLSISSCKHVSTLIRANAHPAGVSVAMCSGLCSKPPHSTTAKLYAVAPRHTEC